MRWLLTTVCLLVSLTPALAQDRLPAYPIDVPPAVVPDHGPWSLDLIDFREEERLTRLNGPPRVDDNPHTFFIVKQHFGVAAGYDKGTAHGSVGYYVTVAEWGRWLQHPSFEIGMGHYPPSTAGRSSDREGSVDVHAQHHRRTTGWDTEAGLNCCEPSAGVRPAKTIPARSSALFSTK
jgi:hypothetical protein